MAPIIVIGGHSVAAYGLLVVLELAAGLTVSCLRGARHGQRRTDILFAGCYAVIGLAAGGKLLYLLTALPQLVHSLGRPEAWPALLSGGFVFYGGLAGALLGLWCYCRRYGLAFRPMADTFLLAVPLAHAFGRVGCFLAGCCYGIPYQGPGHVVFDHALAAPSGVPLFPVQLLEAALLMALFAVLWLYDRRGGHSLAAVYCLGYGLVRLLTEGLRGDIARGIWLGLSTSQWLSLALLLAGVWLLGKRGNALE